MNSSSIRPLAVVTGASNGIGYELAKQFAQNGFDLLVTSAGPTIHEAAQAFQQLGARVEAVQADLATYDGVELLHSRIEAAGRPVEAIAINAGVGVGGEFAHETSLQDELNLINLNDMVDRGQGRILFTSSIAALMPGPFEAVYAASKAFIHSFAEGIRNELKDTGVTVTSLMPGPTDTNFFHRAGMDDTQAGANKKDDPADVAKQGFEALMAGKDAVLAGSPMTKLQGNISKVLPDTINSELHRHLTEPGSANK